MFKLIAALAASAAIWPLSSAQVFESQGPQNGPARAAPASPLDFSSYQWQPTLTTAPWAARAGLQALTHRGQMFVMGGQNFKLVPNPGCAFLPPSVPCTPALVPQSDFFSDVWSSRDGRQWQWRVESRNTRRRESHCKRRT